MKHSSFLCIDAGTSRFKAALLSIDGKIIAKSDKIYAHNKKVHEYTSDDFTLIEVLQNLMCKEPGIRIIGIGITGHGPTLIPIDRTGRSLFPAVGYLDDRVKKYIQRLSDKKSDKIATTMYIPIALFFKEEHPDIYAQTYKFLQSFDYIAYRLTGRPFASSSTSGITLWNEHRLEKAGLDIQKFPEIRYMGEKIGSTTERAADQFGIDVHIPVFAVGVDFAAGLVGTGALSTGRSCERAGSSGGINLCWDEPIHDTRLLCYRHFIKNRYNIAGITSTYGKALEWARSIMGIEGVHIGGKKTAPRGNKPPPILFLPYLKGERTPLWNPFAKGVLMGIDEKTTKDDILYAVYMGLAFSIRDAIEIIEENGGTFKYPVVTTGGLAEDDWFIQLKADVTGKEFAVTQTHDAELLGISIVIAQAAGLYSDAGEAASKIVRLQKQFKPRKELFKAYNSLYRLYKELQSTLAPYFLP